MDTSKPLDHLVEMISAYDTAAAEAERWRSAAETLRKRIQDEIGDATLATVGGLPAFTWKHTGRFNATRFGQDHPDLVVKYTRPVTRDELDEEALKAEQGKLYTAYRGRVFLRRKY